MKDRDKLVFDLIFSDIEEFVINIGDYIDDIYKYDEFISDLKDVLRKSKVSIVKNSIDVNSKGVKWSLKVRK
jgi:hypothetical protein